MTFGIPTVDLGGLIRIVEGEILVKLQESFHLGYPNNVESSMILYNVFSNKKQVRNSSNSWEKQRPKTSKNPQAACFPEYFALQSGSCILALAAANSFMARLAMALAIALALVNQLALGPKTAQLMVSWVWIGKYWKVAFIMLHPNFMMLFGCCLDLLLPDILLPLR